MKKFLNYLLITTLITVIMLVIAFCDDDDTSVSVKTGTASLVLNAEDFHKGYVTQDYWTLAFDHVYMVVGKTTFYQASTSNKKINLHGDHNVKGHPSDGQHAHENGMYLLDLTKEKVQTINSKVTDVPVGNYIYTDYSVTKGSTAGKVVAINSVDASAAAMNDYSIKIIGTATKKDKDPVKFTLAFNFEVMYQCTTESDVCKSTVNITKDTSGQFEITIHLDHLFGADGEAVDNSLDFQKVADLATDGTVELTPTKTHSDKDSKLYTDLVNVTKTVGHAGGECHCYIQDI